MTPTGKVSVVMVNWNGLSDTEECVDSLLRCAYPSLEIVVVDNGSSGGDAGLLGQKYGDRIRVIANQSNIGFVGGALLGLEEAMNRDSGYVLLIGNDMSVEPDLVSRLVDAATAHQDYAFVVPTIMNYYQPEQLDANPERARWLGLGALRLAELENSKELEDCHWASGGCMLLRVSYMEKASVLKAMRPYFLYGDPIWCLSALCNGYRIGYVRSARVYHKGSRSLKRMGPARLKWVMRDYLVLWFDFWRSGYYRGLRPSVLGMYVWWIFLRRPLYMPGLIMRNLNAGTLRALRQGFGSAFSWMRHARQEEPQVKQGDRRGSV